MSLGQGAGFHKRAKIYEGQSSAQTEISRKPIGFTFRISKIPSSITEKKFRKSLNSLPLPGAAEDDKNILRLSYAPSAASADAKRYKTATVTFKSAPILFRLDQAFQRLPVIPEEESLIVDTHFYGLTSLHSCEEPAVDIVAVTGLAGHAFGSWKAHGGYEMWLRDFLPWDIPNSRILTYGYDSTLLNNNSHASIPEFSGNLLEALTAARASPEEQFRPIIFIGHSLGGLVVKQALTKAATIDGQNECIFLSCHYLLFFGVPNKGLDVSGLRSMVKGQPNAKLIKDLDSNPGHSDFLRHHNFFWKFQLAQDTQVISIYETRPTRSVLNVGGEWKRVGDELLMVSKDSAVHATPEGKVDDIFSIDANHSTMVKFVSNACHNYINVRSRIIVATKVGPETIRKRLLCLNGETKFVPRVAQVDSISRSMFVQYGDNNEAERTAILTWLSGIEYIKHHANISEGIMEGSGEWLFNKKEFTRWRSSGVSSILWLHGIPGAGKTKLTSTVITAMTKQLENQRSTPVIYFYCSKGESQRSNPTYIMQALLKQLSLALPGKLPKMVVAEYKKRMSKGLAEGLLRFNESYDLIVSLLDLYLQTTIIIDALDETDPAERWKLLELFETVTHSSTSLVKIFVSSRDDLDIKLKLEKIPNLYIQAEDNREDINRFIRQKVEAKNSQLSKFSPEMRNKIISTLVEKANGMFQWVNLQIEYLNGMDLEEDILENLGKLPQSLVETYEQIQNDMCKGTRYAWELTEKALGWVLCSRKILTKDEWAAFSYWPKQVPKDGLGILFKLCRNLVVWDTQSQAVRFAHLSIREYLENQLSPAKTNTMAAEYCLGFLNSRCRSETLTLSSALTPLPPPSPSIDYSIYYWADHLEKSHEPSKPLSEKILRQITLFLGTPAVPGQGYRKWIEEMKCRMDHPFRYALEVHTSKIYGHLISTPLNPVFVLSYFAFLEPPGPCEFAGFDINCRNHNGETLLFLASLRGNEGMLNILLQQGANVNAGSRDGLGRNPVLTAIKHGHVDIAFQLLDKGAKLYGYPNILEAALGEGDSAVVKAVIDRKPEIEITKDILEAALYGEENAVLAGYLTTEFLEIPEWFFVAAVRSDRSYMIDCILNRDPRVEITEAVFVAAAGKNLECLLDRDPDIKITEAVLVAAAQRGGSEDLKLLLERDPDIKITEAVLVVAAGKNLERLLDRGPDINITEAVLVAAAQRWGSEDLKLLLERDSDTKITEAVLVSAAGTLGGKNLECLLDRDPDTKITRAVLVAAAGTLGGKNLDYLLGRDPDTKIIKTVLVAGGIRRPENLKLLLDRDPDITITEEVLVVAALWLWRSENFKLLLDRDPDIKITEAVLVAAARNWWGSDNFKLLLDRDPDIKITEAVLVAAARNLWGSKNLKLLLDRDPDPKITEAVLVAAGMDPKNLELLLDKDPDIKITGAVLAAATRRSWDSENLKLVLGIDSGMNPGIDMISAEVVGIPNGESFMCLLYRHPDTQITESTWRKAIRLYPGKIDFLKIKITEELLTAIVTEKLGEILMEGLLKVLGDQNMGIEIPEAILAAAEENRYWDLKEVMATRRAYRKTSPR